GAGARGAGSRLPVAQRGRALGRVRRRTHRRGVLQDRQRLAAVGAAEAANPCRGFRRSYIRWRTASNRAMPVATDTLRLSNLPGIGIFTSWSQFSRVSRRRPSPSLPITRATLPLRSSEYREASASP